FDINKDILPTPHTPAYLLNGYDKEAGILSFDTADNFRVIAESKNDVNDKNISYLYTTSSPAVKIISSEKSINKVLIPKLKNCYTTSFNFTLSRITSIFISTDKKWFSSTNGSIYFWMTIQILLMGYFSAAFVLAIKNRTKR
ncbi:MAG: hypothetical protein AAFP10_08625, partial [Pseudomonadota bacterium]